MTAYFYSCVLENLFSHFQSFISIDALFRV